MKWQKSELLEYHTLSLLWDMKKGNGFVIQNTQV